MKISIIGRGCMGNALYDACQSDRTDIKLFGSQQIDKAIKHQSEMVILAVPYEVLARGESFYNSVLEQDWQDGTILIEISNPGDLTYRNASHLQSDLRAKGKSIPVVKSFNTISAFDLVYKNNRKVTVTSDFLWANDRVS